MIRRAVDVLAGLLGLLVAGPAILVLAALVRMDSPGPSFYGGWRAGKDGRRFRMWKLRTMAVGADRTGPGITARSDPRVTRLGAFLRRTKLDELPQLWNLLRGDLTVVGPRPEVPEIVARYTPRQREVLTAKPGLTGPGQLFYTTDQQETIPEGIPADEWYVRHLLGPKLEIDLGYLRRRTLWTDLGVVLRTAGHVARSLAPRRQAP